ncbi:hypothetical protein ACFVYP_10490 [Kitasatospora sp. NPDC058201]|uniref:DUF7691 family protein n=1 Tax=unclassified Kitasatospora TaxID=2633591 RepID=UPI00365BDA2B
MAEQYLSAYAVDADALLSLVGSRDEDLVRQALGRIEDLTAAGALLRATEPAEVRTTLRELVTGRLDPDRPAGYTWLLELLGPTVGEPLGSIVLPGRGWDELTEAFVAWGLPALAELWGRPWAFPRAGAAPDDPWPFPTFAEPGALAAVLAELAGFDTGRIHDDVELLPGGDEDAIEEVEALVGEDLPAWVDGALGAGRGLLLVRDGGR